MRVLRCGLIGANIGASRLSRALGIMCDLHGMGLDFTPIDTAGVPGFDFDGTVGRLRTEGWDGVTVTHPWKPRAADWVGAMMVSGAAGLGAANTLTFRPVAGHNTDHSGFLAAWAAGMDMAPGRVAVAGAGGVAEAVVPALVSLGAEVTVWDRDAGRAARLADRTGAAACDAGRAGAIARDADGLVNCTPLGMWPDRGSAFDAAWIGGQAWAFDAVYTPTDTPFLRACAGAGLRVLTGFDLFRRMALLSFEAYTGIAPDPAALSLLDRLKPVEA